MQCTALSLIWRHKRACTSNRPHCRLYTESVPKKARVVVIGGGIIGTSTAYHLAKMGWGTGDNGTIVLEQDKLTSGTTWHAAGLVETFGSTSETSTRFRQYTRDLYKTLEAETGLVLSFYH